MKLYFCSVPSTISTLLIIGIFVYIGSSIARRNEISAWGKKIAVLALWGLFICILVAMRDHYDMSVQATMDAKILPGLFTVNSIQSTLCSIGGAVIAFCSLSSIFIRKQAYRKTMFFILSSAIFFKVIIIEASRIFVI